MKIDCRITNSKTAETFFTTEASIYQAHVHTTPSERNRIIRAAKNGGFETWRERFDTIKKTAETRNELMTEKKVVEKIAFDSDWRNQPATSRQLSYLSVLGVKLSGSPITKIQASQLIDAAKNGYLSSLRGQDEGAENGRQFIGEVY